MTDRVVLVVGSLHCDIMVEADHLPRRDETAIGDRWYRKFGGKGGNQAVAVARAGGRARMLGAVGTDDFGAFLEQGLARSGVDAALVRRLPGAGSGMSVAVQDRAGDYAATIVSGANLQIDPDWLADPAAWQDVALLLLQNEVPAAVNLAAAQAARARGISVVLNAAPWRTLAPELAAGVDLLVVNAVEAEMQGAGPVTDLPSAERAARHLAGEFAAVVVTAGGNGLALATSGGPAQAIPAKRVDVVSTHGAGDAFAGALAAAMAAGTALAPACALATAAAARHVSGRPPE